MSFYIGQKVVCVSAPICSRYNECAPVVGGVYTIRGIDVRRVTGVGLWLNEIRNPKAIYDCGAYGYLFDEPSFITDRFRPLEEADLTAQIALSWKETVPVEQEVVNPVPEPLPA